ncbi:MAG: thiamine-phosphate kinase [Alistipes sp.]|jgi:thiamine-monophosphate kinase|nr:thiamine-phosphate kinase [Alistipes sp.]
MRTEISELGEFALIDRLTDTIETTHPTTIMGAGDDAAVLSFAEDNLTLLTTDLLLEGVDFDLSYFPLMHLGYKAVTRGVSDILAMNGLPTALTLSLGVSSKLSVEDLEDLYSGVRHACGELGCDIVGGDTTASVNGLTINVSVVGTVPRDRITYRSGARENDLVFITGDLGAAYLGLHLLERERRALADVDNPQPQFDGYEYLLVRQLRPRARRDIVDALAAEGIVPTSMIDLSDGLASDLLQICRSSEVGTRIYLDRLPIARETHNLAAELNLDPVVAALNGGDDHELLFTVPLEMQERVTALGLGIEMIGYITPASGGAALITPDGEQIPLQAQGFRSVVSD